MKLPSRQEMKLLRVLVKHGTCTGKNIAILYEIAAQKPIPHGTLYTTLGRMKERKWLQIAEVEADRRFREFRITALGVQALNEGTKDYAK